MSETTPPSSSLILYQTEDGRTRIQCRFENETVWLSLNQMADLFQRDKSVISRHVKNVFGEGELSAAATVAKIATVQTEGGKQVSRDIEFYNLDVIISARRRAALEAQGEADLLGLLDAEVKKLPKRRKPNGGRP